MKKILSLMLAVLILTSIMTVSSNAVYSKTEAPEWMITKICPDNGNINSTYPDAALNTTGDPFEAYEIVNISGNTLNLYDYGMNYNGNGPTNEKFETLVVEVTPFKAGDWRDNSKFEWPNMPKNPDTCMVAPGEVVVIWSVYIENWPDNYGNGNATIEEFRKHWNIPADVKVIVFDGNSSSGEYQSGDGKNFNIKNSACGTYGIHKNGVAIEDVSTYDDIISWATVNFDKDIVAVKNANYCAIFGYDASSDDVRRAKLLDYTDAITMGVLTDAQKASLGDLLKSKEVETTAAPAITTAAPAATTAAPAATPATTDSTVIVAGMLAMATALTLALRKKTTK